MSIKTNKKEMTEVFHGEKKAEHNILLRVILKTRPLMVQLKIINYPLSFTD